MSTLNQPPGLVHGLTFQQQPTSVTCVHTCLAMALGVPVAEIIARAGHSALNTFKLCAVLTQCGVTHDLMAFGTLGIFQGWHFATVPSLNRRGGFHQVLIRWHDDDGLSVLDPAIGETYHRDGRDLCSWGEIVIFTPPAPGLSLPDKFIL